MLGGDLTTWEWVIWFPRILLGAISAKKQFENRRSGLTIFNSAFSIIPTSSQSYWIFSCWISFRLCLFSQTFQIFLLLFLPWEKPVSRWLLRILSCPCFFYYIIPSLGMKCPFLLSSLFILNAVVITDFCPLQSLQPWLFCAVGTCSTSLFDILYLKSSLRVKKHPLQFLTCPPFCLMQCWPHNGCLINILLTV